MLLQAKNFNLTKLKNPYVLVFPMVASTAASAYSIFSNSSLASAVEHNYLARIALLQPGSSSAGTKTSIHGKEISFEESNIPSLIQSDRSRLEGFYRHYSPMPITVSADDASKKDDASLFVHLRDKNEQPNVNNFWLDNVHLNQISIDRYGHEYDDKGVKKNNSEAKVHSIVKWQDIELDKMSNEELANSKLPSISFRFFNSSIPKSEVEILMNEDKEKYKINEEEGTPKDLSLDWFVWLDKSLLTLKMNYALQTYVFNQTGAQSEPTIKQIIGDTTSGTNSLNNDQKAKRAQAESNYRHLPEKYKTFAESYVTTFLDTAAGGINSVTWSSLINNVTTKDSFIKTDDLNKIYNRFKAQSKDLGIFDSHLVTKITHGENGNWRISLNLEKDKSSTTEEKKDDKAEEHENKTHEARDIPHLTSGSSEDFETRKKNLIHIIPDTSENNNNLISIKEIFDRTKNYSVRNFVFSEKPEFVSSTYSSSTDAAQKEAIKLISFQHKNEFGLYVHEKWIPVILAAIFLLGVLAYLITSFRGPGALMGSAVVASAVSSIGSFFFLGSQLSLVGVFASFIGLFYSLFLTYYLLGFLKKVFGLEFLDPSNVWAVFKRGLVLSTDISLPFFVYSTFVTFLAPVHLREFGIVLALFTIFSYLFVSVAGCLMAISRSVRNFVALGNYFRRSNPDEDFYLNACGKVCSYGRSWIIVGLVIVGILISGTVLFSVLGFNSFSFLKENSLVISKSAGNRGNIVSKLTGLYETMQGQDAAYLTSNLGSGTANLLKSDAIVTSTDAFKDLFVIKDLAFSFLCSFVLISFYVFIRFKFRNLLILLLNTSISFVMFISLLLISRIFISSPIAIAVCSFFALALLYNISSFGLEQENTTQWYSPLVKGISHGLHSRTRWTICWLAASLALSFFSSFWMIAIYMCMVMVFAHLSLTFLYQLLLDKLSYVKSTYMWKSAPSDDSSFHHSHEEVSLDAYDEELIEGINKRI